MCALSAGHVFPIILLGSESPPTAAACLSPTSYLQICRDDTPGPAPTPGRRSAPTSLHLWTFTYVPPSVWNSVLPAVPPP